jgi:AcrR family transcriptional regulator
MVSGRKREFDKQNALDAAMKVFWNKGYLGASLTDLTEGMGINKPSMYSAFGNKEDLFLEATKYYIDHHAKPHAYFLSEPGVDITTRVKNYLISVVTAQCDAKSPKGCYISLCVAEAAADCMPKNARALIDEAGKYAVTMLTDFLQHDPEAKALKLNELAAEKSLFLVTILHGTASMARSGKTMTELNSVISNAMLCLNLPRMAPS